MNVLDLFSGIGGFSLGLERAGMRTVAFCEINTFCRAVLRKHWPGIPCYEDVRMLTGETLCANGIAVDVICGGFPCVDISVAGKGAGLGGTQSGLWTDFARIIGEVRPRYAIVENVAVLASRGLQRILWDLAALGYDAEWTCIRACDLGAPHIRDRIWIVAYPSCLGPSAGAPQQNERSTKAQSERPGSVAASYAERVDLRHAANTDGRRCESLWLAQHGSEQRASGDEPDRLRAPGWRDRPTAADALPIGPRIFTWRQTADAAAAPHDWRLTEPPLCRADDGIFRRVDRIRSLGNSLIPQIPELIGRALMEDSKDR